jgi:hypothetical protein
MIYGNCLLGSIAIILNRKKRKKKSKLITRFRPDSYVPHFMVKSDDKLYHYKFNKNILPWPFCYLIFHGSFQVVEAEKEILFINQKGTLIWALSISLFLGILLAIYVN